MKMIKKIVALMAVALLLLSIVPMAVMAEETATLSFDSKDNRTSYSTTKQVWEQNGITFTNNKSSSTTNVGDYAKPVRLYASSEVIVEHPGMTKIEFDCNSTSYATTLKSSIGNTATVSSDKVTVTLNGEDSFTITKLTGQVRLDSITVYYNASTDPGCEHTNTQPIAGKDATCTETGLSEGTVCADCDLTIEKQETIPALGHNYVDGICTRCDMAKPAGFELTTNVADLTVGDQVIIVAAEYAYAMSTNQKDNNRGQASITKEDSVIAPPNDVQVFTLVKGSVADTFAFYTGAGYLYAASSSANHLKTQDKIDANASWTITIGADGVATIVAQGSNTRNTMQYNQSSSLFACYASASQKAIAIYRIDGEAPACDYDHTSLQCGQKCPNECGVANENSHTYINEYDASCNNCTYVRDDATPMPEADSELTISQALAIGANFAHNTYTEGKYYITGKVVRVENETYGNTTIEDADGNQILVYGTYSADGEIRFDAMDIQPEIGDIVTVYGVIGNYNGNAQMKSGWVTAHQVKDLTFIGKSVTEEGNALAFRFKVGVRGMAILPNCFTQADYSNATIIVDGVEYKLLAMGAKVSNDNATLDIHAKYLYDLADNCAQFAVRIINIPEEHFDKTLTAVPYYVIEKDGNQEYIYGDAVTGSVADFVA